VTNASFVDENAFLIFYYFVLFAIPETTGSRVCTIELTIQAIASITTNKMGAKTDASVASTAISDELSQEPSTLDIMTPRGTPFSKMLHCCLPLRKFNEESLPVLEEIKDTKDRSLPPVVVTELENVVEASVADESDTKLFDTGLIFQIAMLGGVLVASACSYI